MIDKTALITTVFDRLNGLPIDHYLDLRTYKRNRSIIIIKRGAENFEVLEDGYFQSNHDVEIAKLKKILKVLLKKEFPRSNKIRLYCMGEYSPDKVKENLRKVI